MVLRLPFRSGSSSSSMTDLHTHQPAREERLCQRCQSEHQSQGGDGLGWCGGPFGVGLADVHGFAEHPGWGEGVGEEGGWCGEEGE